MVKCGSWRDIEVLPLRSALLKVWYHTVIVDSSAGVLGNSQGIEGEFYVDQLVGME
jgi:hypothetical protein